MKFYTYFTRIIYDTNILIVISKSIQEKGILKNKKQTL